MKKLKAIETEIRVFNENFGGENKQKNGRKFFLEKMLLKKKNFIHVAEYSKCFDIASAKVKLLDVNVLDKSSKATKLCDKGLIEIQNKAK